MIDITHFTRRKSTAVAVGKVTIGGDNPVVVQSMTNSATSDTAGSLRQIRALYDVGCPVVRLTAQGRAEGENLKDIVEQLRGDWRYRDVATVADIHFTPEVAIIAAQYVDKVRINPGNFSLAGDHLERLLERCKERGVAIRIGVNHGSLSPRAMEQYGDTPQGMVSSAMEFLERCRKAGFEALVVSMKSSNTRVMVHAYRLLVEAMDEAEMYYPIHLGVTEAGNGLEGRIKSAVGIGALMGDGVGDTIRVSLTEEPTAEVPVAIKLVDYFAQREGQFEITREAAQGYSATEYRRRSGMQETIIHSELDDSYLVIQAKSGNPMAELRAAILRLTPTQKVVVKRRYDSSSVEDVAVEAAADMGVLFLDGLADGIWVDAPNIPMEMVEFIELQILQGARVRVSQTEYIACPSCGRTLFDIESALADIKSRTSHLKHLKIGVMGCIVNGPGEMADADYGYVGAARGQITLYKGREVVERNIPQEQALEHLVALIKRCGDWHDE